MGASVSQLITLFVASAQRSLTRMFPGFAFTSTKHNHWYDFGYPDTVTFEQCYTFYKRQGLGRAGIVRPVDKCWQDNPWIVEKDDVHKETKLEEQIRLAFERLQLWQKLKTADERSRVGRYAGVIFRFADSQLMKMPVTSVPGGLDGLVEIIPAFESQLEVSQWDTNEASPTYGQALMYKFNESAASIGKINRSFEVHPDRVHIWSADSSVHGEPALEAGYNDLINLEKIIGAGGEGFWKNAKSAPHLNVDKDANVQTLAQMLGVPVEQISEAMNEVVGDWQKGFDQVLMTQGVDVKPMEVKLPDPANHFLTALQSYAASIPIPLKILVGSQTGERASTEDHKEWNQTCQTRRTQYVIPNIRRILDRLAKFGILPANLVVKMTDLTEATLDEKIARAEKMSTINKNAMGTGERIFTTDEIREVVDMEPGDELGLDLPDDVDDETKGAAKKAA